MRKNKEVKKRVCVYMPVIIDEKLKEIAAQKSVGGKKISTNKLTLMIINEYLKGKNMI